MLQTENTNVARTPFIAMNLGKSSSHDWMAGSSNGAVVQCGQAEARQLPSQATLPFLYLTPFHTSWMESEVQRKRVVHGFWIFAPIRLELLSVGLQSSRSKHYSTACSFRRIQITITLPKQQQICCFTVVRPGVLTENHNFVLPMAALWWSSHFPPLNSSLSQFVNFRMPKTTQLIRRVRTHVYNATVLCVYRILLLVCIYYA